MSREPLGEQKRRECKENDVWPEGEGVGLLVWVWVLGNRRAERGLSVATPDFRRHQVDFPFDNWLKSIIHGPGA